MIYFDVTKSAQVGHRSGLMRVNECLRAALGAAATEVIWDDALREYPTGDRVKPAPGDWFLSAELATDAERPGLQEFLQSKQLRSAAIFHDAIPLKFPDITWPQSVARHPAYMKQLAARDHVWAVSAASRTELVEFWQWQGVARTPPVDVLALGADFNAGPRVTARIRPVGAVPQLLCVGILEPRKNQTLLLDAAEKLWAEGRRFQLHLVGRVNPHFGRPIAARIKELQQKYPGLRYHDAADDETVAALYANARASVFPTLAEGCGLPLLESLWQGVPCVCSDLPVLRENAAGGCLPVPVNDVAAWTDALRRVLTEDEFVAQLEREAGSRSLSTWAEAARAVRGALGA